MSAPTVTGTKEVQQHYNSAWHVCNVKRQMLGYGPISQEQFELAESQKTDAADKKSKSKNASHIKPSKMEKFEKKQQIAKLKAENPQPEAEEEFVPMEYNPLLCIFDREEFGSIDENLAYMKKNFGFELFEREYVVDVEGLLRMLGEKVWLGAQCIQCNRAFKSREACINHMVDLRHTRINYDDEAVLAELDPFYDYSSSYVKFEQELEARFAQRLEKLKQKALIAPEAPTTAAIADSAAAAGAEEDNESDWESEGDSEIDEDDVEAELSGKNLRKTAKQLLAKYGLQPIQRTADGYLRLMDGSEAAPRAAMKVIKQRTGDLLSLKEQQQEGGKLHGLKQRLMLTDGSHSNPAVLRSKEEIKAVVEEHRKRIALYAKVGIQRNKFTRAAPEPQKLMM